MNPSRPLYARATINGKRTDLGFATLQTILLRAAEVYRVTQSRSTEVTFVLEVSGAKLPDSSILNKEQLIEQSMAAQILTDPDEESPFEGITIGRVQEAMSSPEYERYAQLCLPDNRLGLTIRDTERAAMAYKAAFPDCFDHFPKYLES